MTGLVRFATLLPVALLLSGCMQRTVTQTDSRISFDQGGWETGDVDKIKEKFSSGFEIKDGMAVASGNKKGFEAKTFQVKGIENKAYQLNTETPEEVGKSFAGKSLFGKLPEFKTSAAKEGEKTFATQAAYQSTEEFPTTTASMSGREFASSSRKAREENQEYYSGKNSARESSARSTRASADFVVDKSSGQLRPDSSALTEDQVRNILHPES